MGERAETARRGASSGARSAICRSKPCGTELCRRPRPTAVVMLGASYTLFRNEHVRVDLVYGNLGERGRLWVDIFGFTVFLLPGMILLTWMTWPFALDSLVRWEDSPNAGGLLRWPVKMLLPLGFLMLSLQGLSELIKRIALLRGPVQGVDVVVEYQRPEQ